MKGDQLTLGSRIVAVADIFTAIAEDRPYRKGMNNNEIKKIMTSLVKGRAICPYVTNILLNHINEINEVRTLKQMDAAAEYRAFFDLD